MAAIEAATQRAARLVGVTDGGDGRNWHDRGLVLLDADPLANIENTRRIAAIVLAGRLMDRNEWNTVLQDVERQATCTCVNSQFDHRSESRSNGLPPVARPLNNPLSSRVTSQLFTNSSPRMRTTRRS